MSELVKYLKQGKLVITPTDTVYGIMADADNENAIKKVYEVKKRSYDKPLLLLVNGIEMLNDYVEDIDDLTKQIINTYWPGTLTILFKKSSRVNKYITNNEYVAIRYPNNKIIKDTLDELGHAVVSTSANISDSDIITKVEMIPDEILDNIAYVIDGGELSDIASTIIKVEDNRIIFLREGILSKDIKSKFKDFI